MAKKRRAKDDPATRRKKSVATRKIGTTPKAAKKASKASKAPQKIARPIAAKSKSHKKASVSRRKPIAAAKKNTKVTRPSRGKRGAPSIAQAQKALREAQRALDEAKAARAKKKEKTKAKPIEAKAKPVKTKVAAPKKRQTGLSQKQKLSQRALKGWETRRAVKRSEAQVRGWETRRKRAAGLIPPAEQIGQPPTDLIEGPIFGPLNIKEMWEAISKKPGLEWTEDEFIFIHGWRKEDGSFAKHFSRLRDRYDTQNIRERIDGLGKPGSLPFERGMKDIAEDYEVTLAEVYTLFYS